ncbi:hypothetical protein ACFLTU_09995 [Bacteroidota bacterium]
MKKSVTINMINKFYLNLCGNDEAKLVINLLKNPKKDKLLTRIMKTQWDIIEIDELHINRNLNKYHKN